jgi:hypothetical protein
LSQRNAEREGLNEIEQLTLAIDEDFPTLRLYLLDEETDKEDD